VRPTFYPTYTRVKGRRTLYTVTTFKRVIEPFNVTHNALLQWRSIRRWRWRCLGYQKRMNGLVWVSCGRQFVLEWSSSKLISSAPPKN